ncbi:MAG TPA: SDR family NAD(P)-dependent oxidoreductase, partial [Devosia sp.]
MSTTQQTLLLVGATSDIGHATAQVFAGAGWNVYLAARNPDAAQRNRDDIAARSGAEVSTHQLDVLQTESFTSFVDGLPTLPDAVVCVVGEMGDQQQAQGDLE